MTMPSGAAANPTRSSTATAGWRARRLATAVRGQYLVGTSTYEGFFINEVKGTWQSATEMALPAGAQMAGRNGRRRRGVVRSAGNCSAGAAYLDASSEYQRWLS